MLTTNEAPTLVSTKGFHPGQQPRPEAHPLIDNPYAPDIFASGVAGLSHINGMILMALESARYDHSHNPAILERVVVSRLVMPIPAAQVLVVGLNDFLVQQGVSPSKAAAQGAGFQ